MRYLDVDTSSGRKISRIGLGTWQFGSREWGYGDDYATIQARDIVRRALDLGVTLFDTAEMYGFGKSERILGEALGDRRDEAYVATKIFPVVPTGAVTQQRGISSADRLGVRTIDLYQVHQANPVIRDSATMPGMASLRRTGLVGDVGVSNYSLARWRKADAALGGPVLSNQVQYNLVRRGPEKDLIPFAQQDGRVVIAYSPLAQGLLSGRYDAGHRPTNGVRRYSTLFTPENLERVRPLLRVLADVADAHGVTSSQVALAWVLSHPHVAAIPGASSLEQLEKNVEAAELDLAAEEITALDDASAAFDPVTGARALKDVFTAR
ncbi:aldo/keto reductase [Cellulomonas sp. PhB143]|uniref:aldo/keto reductase n=1 Tax=Cellulomonas sp. PhB143 TaxID=2485186 RepID=UPI000F4A73AC|nr:aldo/keto reductase [Cellulomonas sp. PhB143]ROS73546.1 aryl-alcohol dehydrogenase-like predicted oxidoreductase [Cellulomonas sp. PhB143]